MTELTLYGRRAYPNDPAIIFFMAPRPSTDVDFSADYLPGWGGWINLFACQTGLASYEEVCERVTSGGILIQHG